VRVCGGGRGSLAFCVVIPLFFGVVCACVCVWNFGLAIRLFPSNRHTHRRPCVQFRSTTPHQTGGVKSLWQESRNNLLAEVGAVWRDVWRVLRNGVWCPEPGSQSNP
jgi:hypothetical protein